MTKSVSSENAHSLPPRRTRATARTRVVSDSKTVVRVRSIRLFPKTGYYECGYHVRQTLHDTGVFHKVRMVPDIEAAMEWLNSKRDTLHDLEDHRARQSL